MELVEGPTLAERTGGRAMLLEEVLPIAEQIADALEAAHEKGLEGVRMRPSQHPSVFISFHFLSLLFRMPNETRVRLRKTAHLLS
jgi:hypothetical protein